MGLSRNNRGSTPYPLGMGFARLVDEARYVPNLEPSATVEEGSCREAALTSVLEGYEDESWEKDEEGRCIEGEGRSLVDGESEGDINI